MLYPVMADPPVLAGAVHLREAEEPLALAVSPVGAPGTVRTVGTLALASADLDEVPMALTAATW